MGPDGGKLSKRHGATSVGDFREMGYLAPAIINYLALLSWSPGEEREKLTLEEMEAEFDIDRVSKSPAIFDIQKLNWLNGLYIRDLDHRDFHRAIEPFLGEMGGSYGAGQLAVAEAAVQTSMTTLTDAAGQLEDFFTAIPLAEAEGVDEIKDRQAEAVLDMVLGMSEEVQAADEFGADEVDEAVDVAKALLKGLKTTCKEEDIPPKVLFRTLRIALTGKTSGPEVPFLLAGLGRDTVRERLEDARIFAAAR
jgi:glutamyl/glutaminyl-tRNA synthetase